MNQETKDSVIGLLERSRDRQLNGVHFTHEAVAVRENGTSCSSGDPAAVGWCVLGAIWHERNSGRVYAEFLVNNAAQSIAPGQENCLSVVSIHQKRPDLLPELWSRAIELAREIPVD